MADCWDLQPSGARFGAVVVAAECDSSSLVLGDCLGLILS